MKKGFSLIELLVVIGIIATITAVSLPNFIGGRERARDTKRKAEMAQLKTALRLYYNDYNQYPAQLDTPVKNNVKGCGATGVGICPCSTSLDFAAGGAGCDTIYMKKFPAEFGSSVTRIFYFRGANSNDFCLKVDLENKSDSDLATSQARCSSACSATAANVKVTDYAVCAD